MLELMPGLTTKTKLRWVIHTTAVKCEHGALLKAFRCLQKILPECPSENTGFRGNRECSKPPRIHPSLPGALLLLRYLNN